MVCVYAARGSTLLLFNFDPFQVREVTIVDPSSDSSRSLSPTQEERSRNRNPNDRHPSNDPRAISMADKWRLLPEGHNGQSVGDGSSFSDADKGCPMSSSCRGSSSGQSTNDQSPSRSHITRDQTSSRDDVAHHRNIGNTDVSEFLSDKSY